MKFKLELNAWAALPSSSFATDPSHQVHVFGKDGDSFGMDRCMICHLHQIDEVSLCCFLK